MNGTPESESRETVEMMSLVASAMCWTPAPR